MKSIYRIFMAVAVTFAFVSCNFLDIVPDENATKEDTYSDHNKTEKYLYSCYAYLPQSNLAQGSLDFFTGDEVTTAFEHETFAAFPKGNYTASSPVISYWNDFFQGIRQCYMFLEGVDKTSDMDDEKKADYKAQGQFLIAYYHYMLARCYGPIILVKETPNIETKVEDFAHRTPYDECVQWICDKLDAAAAGLPVRRDQIQYGLATSVAAKAVKAKMLLYAASPLFNERAPELFKNMRDPDNGTQLMPTAYDANKWVKARDAMKEAIDFAEQNGYHLYTKQDRFIGDASKNQWPAAGPVRCLRLLSLDYQEVNPEVLLAETRGEGWYGTVFAPHGQCLIAFIPRTDCLGMKTQILRTQKSCKWWPSTRLTKTRASLERKPLSLTSTASPAIMLGWLSKVVIMKCRTTPLTQLTP